MRHTFARGALHLWLRDAQCLSGRFFVAAGYGHLHLLDEGSHTRLARLIALSACLGLPDALTRGCRIGHVPLPAHNRENPAAAAASGARRSSMHAKPASQETLPMPRCIRAHTA